MSRTLPHMATVSGRMERMLARLGAKSPIASRDAMKSVAHVTVKWKAMKLDWDCRKARSEKIDLLT